MMTDPDACMNFHVDSRNGKSPYTSPPELHIQLQLQTGQTLLISQQKFTDADFSNDPFYAGRAVARDQGSGAYVKPFIAPSLQSPAESHRSIGINSPLG